jgi:tagaturonate reductase
MDAFNTPEVEKFINKMVSEETLPVINEDPEELKKFASKILERFYNPYLKHYLKDISLNSLSKWETRNFPTVKDNYTKLNKNARLNTFSFAALLVLYSGKAAVEFTPNDTPEFVEFIRNSFDAGNVKGWVDAVVKNKKIWKEDFTVSPFFIDEVAASASAILNNGMKAALTDLINA